MSDEEKRRGNTPQKGYYNDADDITGAQTSSYRSGSQRVEVDENGMPVSPIGDVPAEEKSIAPSVAEAPAPASDASATPAGGDNAMKNWDDIIGYVEDYMKQHTESEEEKAKREKREKTKQVITGIADLGRALSNLYYTTQHAPNSYNGEVMSDKVQQRIDKAKAERDKERDWHLNYALNMAKMKQGEQNFHFNEERAKAADKQAEARLEETVRHNKALEDERTAKREMDNAFKEWKMDIEERKLSQRELIAKMNDSTRRWAQQMRVSQSEIAHQLAGYVIDEYEYRDANGQKHKVKQRTVVNPQTGELDIETIDTPEVRAGGGAGTGVGNGTGKKHTGLSIVK